MTGMRDSHSFPSADSCRSRDLNGERNEPLGTEGTAHMGRMVGRGENATKMQALGLHCDLPVGKNSWENFFLFLLLIFFQVTVVSNCAMCSQATFLMALSHLRSEICCI